MPPPDLPSPPHASRSSASYPAAAFVVPAPHPTAAVAAEAAVAAAAVTEAAAHHGAAAVIVESQTEPRGPQPSSSQLGNRLRHVPVITIGPRKPRVRGPARSCLTPSPLDPRRGRAFDSCRQRMPPQPKRPHHGSSPTNGPCPAPLMSRTPWRWRYGAGIKTARPYRCRPEPRLFPTAVGRSSQRVTERTADSLVDLHLFGTR